MYTIVSSWPLQTWTSKHFGFHVVFQNQIPIDNRSPTVQQVKHIELNILGAMIITFQELLHRYLASWYSTSAFHSGFISQSHPSICITWEPFHLPAECIIFSYHLFKYFKIRMYGSSYGYSAFAFTQIKESVELSC